VIVLGIAQDGGVPHLGCRQKICLTQHHFVSSLAVVSGDSLYLFDATPDLRAQHFGLIQRYPDLARKNIFDGIFLSHAHIGHYTGLMFLGKESVSTDKVPVYCSAEMAHFLTSNAPWSLLVSNQNIELHVFDSGKSVSLNGLSVTPLAVPHRREFTDTHGFLIKGPKKSLLLISDIDSWEPVKDSLSGWLKTADYALLDGTFYSGNELPGRDIHLVPHPTIEASLQVFQSLAPFRAAIFFIHLNHTNPLLDPDSPESRKLSATPYRVAAEWQEFAL
jgi:Metal-dependent hydrolases of the beta-lactamase superfamily I